MLQVPLMSDNTQRVFATLAELEDSQGLVLGPGQWVELSRERVEAFAAVTGDDQDIHLVDSSAVKHGYDRAIVHGYFLLSLIAHAAPQLWRVESAPIAINYGANRVRFIRPVHVGDKVCFSVTLNEFTPKKGYTLVGARYECVSQETGATVLIADTLVALAE